MGEVTISAPQANQETGVERLLDRARDLIEKFPVAVYACDHSGRILWFNQRAVELWGRSPGDTDLFSGAHNTYLGDQHVTPDQGPVAQALKSGTVVLGQEAVIERPDGSHVRTLLHIAPIRGEAGDTVGAICCFHHANGHHKIDSATWGWPDEFDAFFEKCAVPMHIVSSDGIILRVNKPELDLLGYGREEFVGRHIADFIAEAKDEFLSRFSREEAVDCYSAQLMAKDGVPRHVIISSSADFRDGQVVQRRCVVIDVTKEVHAHKRAAETDERFQQLMNALPAAVFMTDAEGRLTYYNPAAVDLSGRIPDLGNDRWCVSWRLYSADGTVLPHEQCPMAVALRERRPVRDIDIIAERPDGTRVPVMPFPTPVHDESGRFVGAVNVLVDIAELKRAEETASRRAQEQTALYRFTDRLYRAASLSDTYEAALDTITTALQCERASILLFDEAGVMRFVAWRGLSEAYRLAVDGHSPWKIGDRDPSPISINDIDSSQVSEELKAVVRAEGLRGLAFIPIVANGSIAGKFMAYYETPHRFSSHELDLALTIARQLGFSIERQRIEHQRTLLIHEVNHRVKNTLSTVQSLAMQTLRHTERSADARELLESRLAALSRAHDLLTVRSWGPVSMPDVVCRCLEPFQTSDGRITIDGPDVQISPKQALALSMAFHELATNAVKYGALCNDAGRVQVRWTSIGSGPSREIKLIWTERGGPQVTPSKRKGFGARLLERSLAKELGGYVKLQYLTTGVICTIRCPLGLTPAKISDALLTSEARR